MLEVVAEQTGYPTDLLDIDLDLEADLGIDTVKQAECSRRSARRYGIERDDALKLRDYPTLNHVVGFVNDALRHARASPPPRPRRRRSLRRRLPRGDVEARVLEVVAEQTGYPTDMLDMDLDLEADLGIDTVKQAEVFAAIRERYGIERDDALEVARLPDPATTSSASSTTRSACGAGDRGRATAPARPSPAPRRSPRRRSPRVMCAARVLEVVAEQTGYPTDLLDIDLDLEADLGIDTVKQAEVFATIREAYGIERDDTLKLRDYPTLNHVVGVRQRPLAPRRAARPRRRPCAGRSRRGPPARAGAGGGGRRRRMTMCGAGAGDRGRADGLSDRYAGHGSRSGGGSGDRHGQAGGGVRDDPRDLWDRA